jgi:hypothetical protein
LAAIDLVLLGEVGDLHAERDQFVSTSSSKLASGCAGATSGTGWRSFGRCARHSLCLNGAADNSHAGTSVGDEWLGPPLRPPGSA